MRANGSFQAWFGQGLKQALGVGPRLGDARRVGLGEYLEAPPSGTVWHRPAKSDTFVLHSLEHRPVLEVGDTIGLKKGDPMPLPPSGTYFQRLFDKNVPKGEEAKAAVLYQVMPLAPAAYAYALPPVAPTLQGGAVMDPRVPRTPEPGKRWQVFGVDGRNLSNLLVAPVAAQAVAAA